MTIPSKVGSIYFDSCQQQYCRIGFLTALSVVGVSVCTSKMHCVSAPTL